MKLAFLVNKNKNEAQNYRIVRILDSAFKKAGIQTIYIFPSFSLKEYKESRKTKDEFSFYYYYPDQYQTDFSKQVSNNKGNVIGLTKLFFRHPIYSVTFLRRRLFLGKNEQHFIDLRFGRFIKKVITLEKPDFLIAVSNPTYSSNVLPLIESGVKKIWYQIDPFALNGMQQENSSKEIIPREIKVYEASDRIIMQETALSELHNINVLSRFEEKCVTFKFPLIGHIDTKSENNDFTFKTNGINCVYAGALMSPIRRPEYMLALFKRLSKYGINLHIWCKATSMENELITLAGDSVICHGNTDFNEMIGILRTADVLVNLGNSVTNQFPSKLLDYISLGKPIINIVKTNECPTIDVIERYPLGVTIHESETLEESAKMIIDFLNCFVGKKMPLKKAELIYKEYTPAYVAEQWVKLLIELEAI